MTVDVDRDVVVVGGGPVGLACAIEARLRGLSVIVVESRAAVVDKACGEGLMPGALPLLARLGVKPEGYELHGVSYRQGARTIEHLFRGGPGLGVRRTTLQTVLRRRAAELGVIFERATVVGLEQTAARARIAISRGGGAETVISASWVLGCDGLHSTVRRLAGLEKTHSPSRLGRGDQGRGARDDRRYGLRRHYAVAPWSHLIEVYWEDGNEVYVTPVSASMVGVALLGSRGVDFDGAVGHIPELADRLAGADHLTGLRGAGPFRQSSSARTAGRVLLVGDASGYIDAITGEGLRVGFAQARAAVDCIACGVPASYEARWLRETRDFRVLTGVLVRAAQSPLRSAIVPTAVALPRIFGAVVERLAR